MQETPYKKNGFENRCFETKSSKKYPKLKKTQNVKYYRVKSLKSLTFKIAQIKKNEIKLKKNAEVPKIAKNLKTFRHNNSRNQNITVKTNRHN